LIDLIERSLFTAGVVTQRINTSEAVIAEHPELLETVARIQVAAGLLVLQVTLNDSEQLVARVRDRQLVLEDTNRSGVVAAVHELLHEAEIIFDTEKAGL
jgi:hypothetical protein